MNIETVKIETLKYDPKNFRLHDERNTSSIQASLSRFGQQKPIVVDGDGIVIAGNGTLKAALLLGWKDIKIIRTALKGMEAVAYAIADNRTSELADWDKIALTRALDEMRQGEFVDVGATGFTNDEINQMCLGFIEPTVRPEGAGEEELSQPQYSTENQVRMVQLFLNGSTHPKFEGFIKILSERLGTENITDTVFECLKREAGKDK